MKIAKKYFLLLSFAVSWGFTCLDAGLFRTWEEKDLIDITSSRVMIYAKKPDAPFIAMNGLGSTASAYFFGKRLLKRLGIIKNPLIKLTPNTLYLHGQPIPLKDIDAIVIHNDKYDPILDIKKGKIESITFAGKSLKDDKSISDFDVHISLESMLSLLKSVIDKDILKTRIRIEKRRVVKKKGPLKDDKKIIERYDLGQWTWEDFLEDSSDSHYVISEDGADSFIEKESEDTYVVYEKPDRLATFFLGFLSFFLGGYSVFRYSQLQSDKRDPCISFTQEGVYFYPLPWKLLREKQFIRYEDIVSVVLVISEEHGIRLKIIGKNKKVLKKFGVFRVFIEPYTLADMFVDFRNFGFVNAAQKYADHFSITVTKEPQLEDFKILDLFAVLNGNEWKTYVNLKKSRGAFTEKRDFIRMVHERLKNKKPCELELLLSPGNMQKLTKAGKMTEAMNLRQELQSKASSITYRELKELNRKAQKLLSEI